MKVKAFLRKFLVGMSSINSVEIHYRPGYSARHLHTQTKYTKSDVLDENYGPYATENVGSFEIHGDVLIINI